MTPQAGGGGRAYSVPFDDPLGELTPAAQKILAAASRLLVTEGYDALTHERIAKAAGVNKSSIRNSFGNKAAVVVAVVDAMVHDGCLGLSQALEGAGTHERVHGAVDGIREMIRTDAFAGYFDILPHALRDDDLRERVLALYRWWYGENRKWLGMTADRPDRPGPRPASARRRAARRGDHRRALHPGRPRPGGIRRGSRPGRLCGAAGGGHAGAHRTGRRAAGAGGERK